MIEHLCKALTIATLALGVMAAPASAQPYATELASTALSDLTGPFTAQRIATTKFADVNGDGYKDLCYLDSAGVQCALQDSRFATPRFLQPTLFTARFNLQNTAAMSVWETLQYVDINGDGSADLCIRQTAGMICLPSHGTYFFDTTSRSNFYADAFSDANRFGMHPSYWRTIRIVNAWGMKTLCGRGPAGIVCQIIGRDLTFTKGQFYQMQSWGEFSDANNWFNPEYYSTIQFPDLNRDGTSDLCGRRATGIVCFLFSESSNRWTVELPELSFFSDNNYWNQPQYYSTIQFADINGDWIPDLCARGAAGVYCAQNNRYGSRFGSVYLADTFFSDTNWWDDENRYSTIRFLDVNGDGKADVCGRYVDGIRCGLNSLYTGYTPYGTFTFFVFGPAQLWVANFGDDWQWNLSESHWRTVQPVKNWTSTGRLRLSFCGRGNSGIWCSDYR